MHCYNETGFVCVVLSLLGLNDEETLDAIETAFKQFNSFLDLMQDRGFVITLQASTSLVLRLFFSCTLRGNEPGYEARLAWHDVYV